MEEKLQILIEKIPKINYRVVNNLKDFGQTLIFEMVVGEKIYQYKAVIGEDIEEHIEHIKQMIKTQLNQLIN